jgi:uncharacterized repeat protein (TIGR03803 family)
LFAVNTNGAGFTNLHSFTATHTNSAGVYTNSDGADPEGGLVLSGNTLFGAARYGGSSGAGTVFAINTNGTGFTILHSFTAGVVYYGTNSDGANPAAGLILSGNTLYGTASAGGNSGHGTLFAIKTDGTGFTNLHSFSGGSDGANPQAGLVLSGDTLYGTARGGGSAGVGTVFSLSFAPQLTITPSGPNVILSWPTNVAGFDYTGFALQCSAGLSSTNWTNWMNPVTTSGGYYFVSNPISAGAQFFRLKK